MVEYAPVQLDEDRDVESSMMMEMSSDARLIEPEIDSSHGGHEMDLVPLSPTIGAVEEEDAILESMVVIETPSVSRSGRIVGGTGADTADRLLKRDVGPWDCCACRQVRYQGDAALFYLKLI